MSLPIKNGKVSCDYGKNVRGKQWMSGWHQGIDFAAPVGTDVLAVAHGVVVGIGTWGSSFGSEAVIVQHGKAFKRFAIYAHTSKALVKVGDRVKRGQIIAKSGSAGNSTGPHLHFEVQAQNRWTVGGGLNPYPLLRSQGLGKPPKFK